MQETRIQVSVPPVSSVMKKKVIMSECNDSCQLKTEILPVPAYCIYKV